MFQVVTSDNFTIGNNALFLSNQTTEDRWQFLENYREKYEDGLVDNEKVPQITFKKRLYPMISVKLDDLDKKVIIPPRGSLEETRYHLLLAKDLGYLALDRYKETEEKCREVSLMLNSLIKSLKRKIKD